MTSPVAFGKLGVAVVLFDFIRNEALPGTGISELNFWRGLEALVNDLAPRNAELLRHRDHLQVQIDDWHRTHPGSGFDRAQYASFLEEIGYLEPPIADFQIDTQNVDPEISSVAAPQLVVPLDNARYALMARTHSTGRTVRRALPTTIRCGALASFDMRRTSSIAASPSKTASIATRQLI
jgi:malate synthase